jgi:hypothetical protein
VSQPEATLFIESQRLVCFLENNQLVQAHAIANRLEGMFQDNMKVLPNPETHRYWPMFKAVLRCKTHILCGRQKESYQEAVSIQGMLRGKEK